LRNSKESPQASQRVVAVRNGHSQFAVVFSTGSSGVPQAHMYIEVDDTSLQ
jgi:hypothetical protein